MRLLMKAGAIALMLGIVGLTATPAPADDKKADDKKPAADKKPDDTKPVADKKVDNKKTEDKKADDKKPVEDKKPADKKSADDKKPAEDKKPVEDKKPMENKKSAARPASIHVTCPANAVLTLNGEKTTEKGEERWYVTPPLDPGKNYSATLRITFTRDDNSFTVERKVTLRAGKIAHVHFLPKEHFGHLHEGYQAPATPARPPIVVVAPVIVQESEIPVDWPTDWTGN